MIEMTQYKRCIYKIKKRSFELDRFNYMRMTAKIYALSTIVYFTSFTGLVTSAFPETDWLELTLLQKLGREFVVLLALMILWQNQHP